MLTWQEASPTNAWASLAVIALEKPLPWWTQVERKFNFPEMKSDMLREKWSVCPHSDYDDAGLGDDVLEERVEGRFGVVVEALQLLHHVVQLEEGP